jgi:hypothetical protein
MYHHLLGVIKISPNAVVLSTTKQNCLAISKAVSLIVLYIFSITPMFLPVMRDVLSFGLLLFIFAAVYIVLVLRPGNISVRHRLVLTCPVISTMFHIKSFRKMVKKSYHFSGPKPAVFVVRTQP